MIKLQTKKNPMIPNAIYRGIGDSIYNLLGPGIHQLYIILFEAHIIALVDIFDIPNAPEVTVSVFTATACDTEGLDQNMLESEFSH